MNGGWRILAEDVLIQRLEFGRWPQGSSALALLAVLAILIYGAAWLYRHEQRGQLTGRMRTVLIALRVATLAMLAIIFLQPAIATYIQRSNLATTLVLVDESASMSVRDVSSTTDPASQPGSDEDGRPDARISRARRVGEVLGGDEGLLSQLAAANPVRLIGFGEQAAELARIERDAKLSADIPVVADGNVTDLGRAVRMAVESQAGGDIAGLVVLSDGRFNRGESLEAVGRYARSRQVPIYTVGVGAASGARNASVVGVEAPPSVFVNDPFKVAVQIRAMQFEGQSARVRLLAEADGGMDRWQVIAEKSVTVQESPVEPVLFDHRLAEPGETRLRVQVEPLPGEILTEDNQRDFVVRALANKMRVLLIAGGPSWDYRYLARLLERDATIDVSCWLQSADPTAIREGNTPIDHLPASRGELLAYDCVVLMDARPGEFPSEWAQDIEAVVSDFGGGLIYVAGPKFTARSAHSQDFRKVLDLLPVVVDAGEADLTLNELGRFQSVAWPMAVPSEAGGHPVLAMSALPGESAQVWPQLPGVYWHYPVRREKPAATVLLRHSNPRMRNSSGGHVLLASQFLGAGRTAFVGFDSTWRWRRAGDRYFNRFWIQLIRHAVEGKLRAGGKRGFVQPDRDTYTTGDTITINARLFTADHEPLNQPHVEAMLELPGATEQSVALKAQEDRPGWYRGQFAAGESGLYSLTVRPADMAADESPLTTAIQVTRSTLEFEQPALDRDALATLAQQSASGKYLELDQASELANLIGRQETRVLLTGGKIPLWDRWWVLAMLIALLGTEWFIRKRSGLL